MTDLSRTRIELVISHIVRMLTAQDVVLAYLHGSYASETATPLSDIDIAILLAKEVPRSDYARILRDLTFDLSQLIPDIEVDIQILNHAPVEFRYNVIKGGRVIYCADDNIRASFETQTLIEYLDFKYALDTYYAYLSSRLSRGERP
ncbi:MAG: type VII toxin-antitoxin system MntA family adenylyltransferase antitoxin [Candidatus Thorarchaeota archaeon]